MLGLSGLQKVTARLIEGIDIQQSSTKFTVNFVTVVPFFKVTEDVPLDGGSVQLGRRDLRFGRQSTAARSVPGGVLVEMSWGAPMAGAARLVLAQDMYGIGCWHCHMSCQMAGCCEFICWTRQNLWHACYAMKTSCGASLPLIVGYAYH